MKRKVSIVSSVLFFPLGLLVSQLVSWYFKSTNPDSIDISQGLAYLSQSIVTAGVVMGVLLLVSIVFCYLAYKEEGNKGDILPFLLIGINVAAVLLLLFVSGQVSRVQDQYLIDNGRPTLQQFFENLKK